MYVYVLFESRVNWNLEADSLSHAKSISNFLALYYSYFESGKGKRGTLGFFCLVFHPREICCWRKKVLGRNISSRLRKEQKVDAVQEGEGADQKGIQKNVSVVVTYE